ncbi:unnamed protein product [Symbiodinium sp. CCMP2592]|nr:unnamed protein product [Symbiodinium sp. CCMP2592]
MHAWRSLTIRSTGTGAASHRHQRGFSARPAILWAPGLVETDDRRYERLGAKIRAMCRDSAGPGYCVVGARGEIALGNTLRGLASASELAKSPIEFMVRWHEEQEGRALRFRCQIHESWGEWKQRWFQLDSRVRKPLSVTPNTDVEKLAEAMAVTHRKLSGVAFELNPNNNAVLSIAAKALATTPRKAHREEIGAGLVCALRWPSMDHKEASTRVYGHVYWRTPPDENWEVPPQSGRTASSPARDSG